MDQFEQPLEGIFRDGIPAPVLRAFAPLYQALPTLQEKVNNARDCYYWRPNPAKCLDEDIDNVTAFMQASETAFRLCPQQSATLLKCHMTEPARAVYFCRDEEWEWRSCLMDQTGVRFWPYANAPIGAPWSNGGQTEDFHLEDRFFHENFAWWRRRAAVMAIRRRDLEIQSQRKHWLEEQANGGNELDFPKPTLAPIGINNRGSSARMSDVSDSISSIDSLHVDEGDMAPLASPIVALKERHPSTQDIAVVQEPKRLRAPSTEELLHGGISMEPEHGVGVDRAPCSVEKDGPTDSFAELATRQFLDEMCIGGILAVEKVAYATPKTLSEQTSPYSLRTGSGDNSTVVNHGASPSVKMEFTPGGKKIGALHLPIPSGNVEISGSPSSTRSGITAKVASVSVANCTLLQASPISAERVLVHRSRNANGYTIPPPMPSPSPEQTDDSTKRPDSIASFRKRKPIPALRPPSLKSPQEDACGRESIVSDAIAPLLSLPRLHSGSVKRGIPVTRLLEEEGRGIVAEEAVFWRGRCEELEKIVLLLRQQVQDKKPPESAENSPATAGSWREEGNAFGCASTAASHPHLCTSASLSPSAQIGKSGGVPPEAASTIHNTRQSSRGPSPSSALRSVSPQSPENHDLLAAMCVPDGEEINDDEGQTNAPQLLCPAATHAFMGFTTKTRLAEVTGSTERSDAEGRHTSPGEKTNATVDDPDELTFDSNSVSLQDRHALANGTNSDGWALELEAPITQGDNLRLVLVERLAHDLKRQLDRAREDADALKISAGRYRLRCDELETRALTLEEQLLSQKDQLEQRIQGLEASLATATNANSGGSSQRQLTSEDANQIKACLQTLSEYLSADSPTEDQKTDAVVTIDSALNVLQRSTAAAASPAIGTAAPINDTNQPGLTPPASMTSSPDRQELHALVCLIASISDPVSGESCAVSELSAESELKTLVAAAKRYAGLAQEMADTQAIQIAELREELEVVRRDRNELIGQQGEQVRRLQEELLKKENANVALLEKAEALAAMQDELRDERDTLQVRLEEVYVAQQMQLEADRTGTFDAETLEHKLRTEFEKDRRDACADLERKLREAQTAAEVAQRAQHSVFSERLASAQGQLRDIRVVTNEEREKFKADIDFLMRELRRTQDALDAKEVALSIALREDVPSRRSIGETVPRALVLPNVSTITPSVAPSVPALSIAAYPSRGGSREPSFPEKLENVQRAASLSISSQGFSMGESTTATRRANSGSNPINGASVQRTSLEGNAFSQMPTSAAAVVVPAAMQALEHESSPELSAVSGSGPRTRSPSPILAGMMEGLGQHHQLQFQQLDSLRSPPTSGFASEASIMNRALDDLGRQPPPVRLPRRMPSRQAPDPASPFQEMNMDAGELLAIGTGAAVQREGGARRVMFVGVPPLMPSPAASAVAHSTTSPLPMTQLDASGWGHAVSRSLSSSFADSPNTAFVREEEPTGEGVSAAIAVGGWDRVGKEGGLMLAGDAGSSPSPRDRDGRGAANWDDSAALAAAVAALATADKENRSRSISASRPQSTTTTTRLSAHPTQSSPLGERTFSSNASPLQQREGNLANNMAGGDGSVEWSSAKRKFVKMGSLQRMREVWARQESLLLGSPSSSRGTE